MTREFSQSASAGEACLDSAQRAVRVHCPVEWPDGLRCLNCHARWPERAVVMTTVVEEPIAEHTEASSVLAVHRPADDGLCAGCLDLARLAMWPCPRAADAASSLTRRARGVAKVHIGRRSGLEIPDGPYVKPSLTVEQLEQVLVGLRELR